MKHSPVPPVSVRRALKPLKTKKYIKHVLYPQGPAGISGRPGTKVRSLLCFLKPLCLFIFIWLLKWFWNCSLGRPRWTRGAGGEWAARNPRKARSSWERGQSSCVSDLAETFNSWLWKVTWFTLQQYLLSPPFPVLLSKACCQHSLHIVLPINRLSIDLSINHLISSKYYLVKASPMWEFTVFFLFYITVNGISMGFGLSVRQNKTFYDITLDYGKLWLTI